MTCELHLGRTLALGSPKECMLNSPSMPYLCSRSTGVATLGMAATHTLLSVLEAAATGLFGAVTAQVRLRHACPHAPGHAKSQLGCALHGQSRKVSASHAHGQH